MTVEEQLVTLLETAEIVHAKLEAMPRVDGKLYQPHYMVLLDLIEDKKKIIARVAK